jgi:hypothetical protein
MTHTTFVASYISLPNQPLAQLHPPADTGQNNGNFFEYTTKKTS